MSSKNFKLSLLGRKIQNCRKEKKISQTKMSVLLGITREHLSKIERGVAFPSLKILFEIADILKVKLNELIDF